MGNPSARSANKAAEIPGGDCACVRFSRRIGGDPGRVVVARKLPFPLTCAGEVLRTKTGIAAIAIGALASIALWHVAPLVISRYERVGTVITSADVITVDPQMPAFALAVKAQVFISPNCRRMTHFALANAAKRQVYPLGQIMSGAGFSAPWTGEYRVVLQIPPAIDPGDYSLTVRAVYDCSWLWVFRETIVQQSQSVPVALPWVESK